MNPQNNRTTNKELLETSPEEFLPSVSVDCVILGFDNGRLKILLSKFKTHDKWMIPGGFVYYNEDVDVAAHRILEDRTGLNKIYLRQFHLFGDRDRTNIEENKLILRQNQVLFDEIDINHWFLKRFVSVGYYAFVDYSKVKIYAKNHEDAEWFDFDSIPPLYSDHNYIVEKARTSIQMQLNSLLIGYELLPSKFTMTELRVIYETIYGKKIDRRNFQRRVLMSGLVYKLDEVCKKKGMKESALYAFDEEKYKLSIEEATPHFGNS